MLKRYSDEKQLAALGSIFEIEKNAVQRIVHWGSLAFLYHLFLTTASRFASKAFSRFISICMPKRFREDNFDSSRCD